MSKLILIIGRNKDRNKNLINKIKTTFIENFIKKRLIIYYKKEINSKNKEQLKYEKIETLLKKFSFSNKTFVIYDFELFFNLEKNNIIKVIEKAKKYEVNLILECSSLDLIYFKYFDKIYFGHTNVESDFLYNRRSKIKEEFIKIKKKP